MKSNKVLTDIQQTLSETEKSRARTNIDAVAESKFTEGNGAPTTTPTESNLYYFDNTNGDLYVSKGTHDFTWKKIGGSGGESGTFIATYKVSTFDEVKAALDGGKVVFLKVPPEEGVRNYTRIARLDVTSTSASSTYYTFSDTENNVNFSYRLSANGWTSESRTTCVTLGQLDAKFTQGSGEPDDDDADDANKYYFDESSGKLYVTYPTSEAAISEYAWKEVSGGGSGDSDIFIATYNETTLDEITAAVNAGKVVIVKEVTSSSVRYYTMVHSHSLIAQYTFCAFVQNKIITVSVTTGGVGWRKDERTIVVEGSESVCMIPVDSSSAASDYTKAKEAADNGRAVIALDATSGQTWMLSKNVSNALVFSRTELDSGSVVTYVRELRSTGWQSVETRRIAEESDVTAVQNRLEGVDTCSIWFSHRFGEVDDYSVLNFHGKLPPVINPHDNDLDLREATWTLHGCEVENQSGNPETGPWDVQGVYLSPDHLKCVSVEFTAEYDGEELQISDFYVEFHELSNSSSDPSFTPPARGLIYHNTGDNKLFISVDVEGSNDWVQIGG